MTNELLSTVLGGKVMTCSIMGRKNAKRMQYTYGYTRTNSISLPDLQQLMKDWIYDTITKAVEELHARCGIEPDRHVTNVVSGRSLYQNNKYYRQLSKPPTTDEYYCEYTSLYCDGQLNTGMTSYSIASTEFDAVVLACNELLEELKELI